MSRTLKELQIGTLLYVNEIIDSVETPKPYIVTRVNSNNSVEIERMYSPYTYQINSTNNSVYTDSKMDTHLNDATDGFKARLSEALQSRLVLNAIPTYTYGDTEPTEISRSIYLASKGEYFLDDSSKTTLEPLDNSPVVARMTQMKTLTANNARKCYDETGSAVICWLRSPNGANYTVFINTVGTESYDISGSSCGFRPVLCLDGDTIVSDEGSETIMLLPEEREYNEIDFQVTLGERTEMPERAVCVWNATNLYDTVAQICTNVGSETEVWTTVTNDTEIELPECTKTTNNYVIGFKFYGKATELASIDEPEVYVK